MSVGTNQPTGNIKGVALSQLLSWHQEQWSPARSVQAVKLAHARFPGYFDPSRPTFGVLASHWYPAAVVHVILDELTRGLSASEAQAMAVTAAEGIMTKTLSGVHRAVFTMFASPDRYARHVDMLWGLHYDTGRVQIELRSETEHSVTYVGWTSHHPWACQMNMAASLPLYGAMGCSRTRYQVVGCVSTGHARCQNEISWSHR